MNITTYKIPVTLTRDGDQVQLELDESKKEVVNVEKLGSDDLNGLPGLAQKIGAENETAKALLKKTLLREEKSSTAYLMLKILS